MAEWTPVDVNYLTHPTMVAAGPDGKLLYLAGLCYSQAHSSDGIVPDAIVAGLVVTAPAKKTTPKKLVDLGLWERLDGGYRIVAWHDWNDPKAEIDARKEAERRRKAEWRRKRRESHPRDAGRDADATGTGTGRDASVPLLQAQAPSPAPRKPAAAAAENSRPQDATIAAAAEIIGDRQGLAARIADPQVRNPEGLRRSILDGIERDLRRHPDLGRLIHDRATPETIADLLAPAAPPPAVSHDGCPTCDSTGWLETADGVAYRCGTEPPSPQPADLHALDDLSDHDANLAAIRTLRRTS